MAKARASNVRPVQRDCIDVAKVTEKDACFREVLAEQVGRLYHHHRFAELKCWAGSSRRALPCTSELPGGFAEVPRHLRVKSQDSWHFKLFQAIFRSRIQCSNEAKRRLSADLTHWCCMRPSRNVVRSEAIRTQRMCCHPVITHRRCLIK